MKKVIALAAAVCLLLALSGSLVSAGAESGSVLQFETTDLDGNPVLSRDLFEGHPLTMISLWETEDDLCIGELPELEKLNQEYSEYGFQVIGIVTDAENEETAGRAKEILEEQGVTYPNLMASEELADMLPQDVLPASWFVDETGTLTGEAEDRADPERYRETIDSLLGRTPPDAYILHVVDQNGDPVEEVMVNFCTDTACTPRESDENGRITFSGAPGIYHIQMIDAPEGYSWDEDFELYTTPEYAEWTLQITRD